VERRISEVTRRDIIDYLQAEQVRWWGRLDEPEFLARIYDLHAMPSSDPRFRNAAEDIAQHRIRNLDWDDDWIFFDERFGLLHGEDQTLLRFLAEMLHPAVNSDPANVDRLVNTLNQLLRRDAYELVAAHEVSGRPVYAGRQVGEADSPAVGSASEGPQLETDSVAAWMEIPDSVIYVVGDVLGNWYYSHTKLNTLFGSSGFPGDPPEGNCVTKCQEWMRRANQTPGANPIELLGNVLTEYMNLEQQNNTEWVAGVEKIRNVLAKNGLAFELNGIVAQPPSLEEDSGLSTPAVTTSGHRSPTTPQSPRAPSSSPDSAPITILFLAANPDGQKQLALDRECRAIRERLRMSEFSREFKLQTEWAVRPRDLLQYLNEYLPQVVHFSGHGTPAEELILHHDDERARPVGTEALHALFSTMKDNIRLVVLNACYSQPQATAIVEEIDCAVGMKRGIGDRAAAGFAAAFYSALGFGRSVQDAFDQARAALLLEGVPEADSPELLVKQGADASRVFLAGPATE